MEGRVVLLAGATGLVGRELLAGLLADSSVGAVHSFGRRRPTVENAKLTAHTVDFAALPALPRADEAYLALGTTIKAAGSESAFRAVDFDANFAFARAALAAGARRAGLVSAMGASAASRVFYSRVKGELESAMSDLGFEGIVIARPSLLVGDRAALDQPIRPGERVGFWLSGVLGPLIPRNYVPIAASRVARALLDSVPAASGRKVLFSGAMQ